MLRALQRSAARARANLAFARVGTQSLRATLSHGWMEHRRRQPAGKQRVVTVMCARSIAEHKGCRDARDARTQPRMHDARACVSARRLMVRSMRRSIKKSSGASIASQSRLESERRAGRV